MSLPLSLLTHTACTLEVLARKPGNVHPGCGFADVTALDFLLSAAAIAPVFEDVAGRGVGASVREAVQRTRVVVASNTNLGIILLLAPLAAARGQTLSELWAGVESVLAGLTVDDAASVFEAIRLANPGGLGRAAEQDVNATPTLPLRAVMSLAADRDLVARQYHNGFADVFDLGVPALLDGLQRGWPLEEAIVFCQLRLLAALGDSLIGRKRGAAESAEAATRAAAVLAAGWPATPEGRAACCDLDVWLRAVGHARNPGSTADLVTAALFAALRTASIPVPLPPFASTRL